MLHLVYDYPPTPTEDSHVRFADVELYHFVHTGGSILFGIDEVPVARILDQRWDEILRWAHRPGGVPNWDRDDRATYQAKLEAGGYKAWDIRSSIGFDGFVIAKSIDDVTHEYHPTA